MADRPAAEITIDEPLVRSLIREQHPDLGDLRLDLLERGWDNTNYRLGSGLVVRLPHRLAAAELILHEQRWLPELAPRIGIPIPAPIRAGVPSDAFPWHWSITPWFEGEDAARAELADPVETARDLGDFLAELHRTAPPGAPTNPFRGVPLGDRRSAFEESLAALDLDAGIERPAVEELFARGEAAPPDGDRRWLHGDLHTRSILIDRGSIAAVIDWGDVCAGDPACDLASAYMLVPDHVDVVAARAGADEPTWIRARGWAAHFGVIYTRFGDDDEVMADIGRRLLASVVDAEQPGTAR